MEIVWHGHACFRLKSKELAILTDPFDSKAIGLPLGKPAADVVTVSHSHPGHSSVSAVSGSPKVIDAPGEYEIRGIFITGIQTYHDNESGKKSGKNVVYLFEIDDLMTCHLGDLGHPLTEAQAEAMSAVDVLLVPIGGAGMLTIAQAAELIGLIEPKITIPMRYASDAESGSSDPLERFCRELGVKVPATQPRLVVNRSQLPQESQVVVLEQRKA